MTEAAPVTNTPPKLLARSLTKSYGGRRVVQVEELAVAPGETLAVLGPNGAGKSTLFRLMALLEKPDSGRIELDGRPVGVRDLEARRRMASVFQRPLLFQGSVRANVEYGLRLRRVPRSEAAVKVEEALALVGLSAFSEADVRGLSGGELQRVALARALVLSPEVLLLDEPTSNLDPSVRQRFRSDLRSLIARIDATVVLITHDQAEAMMLADRTAVLRDGQVVQVGPPEEVFARPRDTFVAEFMGVETLWPGIVRESEEGLVVVDTVEGITVQAVTPLEPGAEVTLGLRAEDVLLRVGSAERWDGPGDAEGPGGSGPSGGAGGTEGLPRDFPARSSARNHWRGRVEALEPLGPVVRVRVAVGPPERARGSLVSLVTRRSAEELGLAPGLEVEASIKATAVQVLEVPAECSERQKAVS